MLERLFVEFFAIEFLHQKFGKPKDPNKPVWKNLSRKQVDDLGFFIYKGHILNKEQVDMLTKYARNDGYTDEQIDAMTHKERDVLMQQYIPEIKEDTYLDLNQTYKIGKPPYKTIVAAIFIILYICIISLAK